VESRIVQQAALATARWVLLARADVKGTAQRVSLAKSVWEAERDEEVERWAAGLHPDSDNDPARAVSELRRTAAGCKRLAASHAKLIEALSHPQRFSQDVVSFLMRLHGIRRVNPRFSDDQKTRALWYCILAIYLPKFPRTLDEWAPLLGVTRETLKSLLPTPKEGVAQLIDSCRRERRALVRRALFLARTHDIPDVAFAREQSLFDPSGDGAFMNRYLNDSARNARAALTQLDQMRKSARQSERQSS